MIQKINDNEETNNVKAISGKSTPSKPNAIIYQEEILKGLAISDGIAIGNTYIVNLSNSKLKNIPKYLVKDKDIKAEIDRLHIALKETQKELSELEQVTHKEIGEAESKIFLAMNMITSDKDFLDKITKGIKYNKQNAESVLKSVIDYYIYRFSNIKNDYIKERAHDIEELGFKILANLIKNKSFNSIQNINTNKRFIVVASKLTPQITSSLNKEQIAGIISEHGSYSSHAGILARGMSLPAVSGIKGLINKININTELIIDGYEGIVIINPTKETIEKYKEKLTKKPPIIVNKIVKNNIVETNDGTKVELMANISGIDDFKYIEKTMHNIGLFRTEFLFINSEKEPSEKHQFEFYKSIISKMGKDRISVFRTLDIGYDKIPSYLPIEECDNPALGLRGIRLSLHNKRLLKNQGRALLRASTYGKIKIMFPMINSIREFLEAKTIIEQEKINLQTKGCNVSKTIQYGIMVETPAALLSLETFADHIDFISVGTNDLTQYITAADRNNEVVSEYYNHNHPSIIHALKIIIDIANKYNITVSLCGELNIDVDFLPYLIGLGYRRLSINSIFLPLISKAISELNLKECKEKLYNNYKIS